MQKIIIIISILLYFAPDAKASGAFPLNGRARQIIGANTTYTIRDKETLIELAREYNVGYNEITAANQDVDPWVPEKGAEIILPTSWILPDIHDRGTTAGRGAVKGYNLSSMLFSEIGDRGGIVINLAELRMYYFFTIGKTGYVRTFPLGIGRDGWNTPEGTYRITAKVKDPVWKVPEGIKEEKPELPDFVPPGPDNPLGGYWLHLSINGYGIHGTNRPFGIGRRVSHGCIRLYPEDIEVLFNLVKAGTPVRITDQPVKAAYFDRNVYVEIHRSEENDSELMSLSLKTLDRKHLTEYIDKDLLMKAIQSSAGLPVVISK